jgi:hypothetical protein
LSVPLQEIAVKGTFGDWFTLTRKGKPSGTLKVDFEWSDQIRNLVLNFGDPSMGASMDLDLQGPNSGVDLDFRGPNVGFGGDANVKGPKAEYKLDAGLGGPKGRKGSGGGGFDLKGLKFEYELEADVVEYELEVDLKGPGGSKGGYGVDADFSGPKGGAKSDYSLNGPKGGYGIGADFNGPKGGAKSDYSLNGPKGGYGIGADFNGPNGGAKSNHNLDGPKINYGVVAEFNGPRGGAKSDYNLDGPKGGYGVDVDFNGPKGGAKSDYNLNGPKGGAKSDYNLNGPKGGYGVDVEFNGPKGGAKSDYNLNGPKGGYGVDAGHGGQADFKGPNTELNVDGNFNGPNFGYGGDATVESPTHGHNANFGLDSKIEFGDNNIKLADSHYQSLAESKSSNRSKRFKDRFAEKFKLNAGAGLEVSGASLNLSNNSDISGLDASFDFDVNQSRSIDRFQGILFVIPHEAKLKDILTKSKLGKMDLAVQIKIGDQEKWCKPCLNTGLEPQWGDPIQFDVEKRLLGRKRPMHVEIWDRKNPKNPKFLCESIVKSLDLVVRKKNVTEWYELTDRKRNGQGNI